MISPVIYALGGVVLIGGAWYAYSKWAGPKCLDKATLASTVESILHGDKTSAEARKLADALEKAGCAAADVKSIRDAADARDKREPVKLDPGAPPAPGSSDADPAKITPPVTSSDAGPFAGSKPPAVKPKLGGAPPGSTKPALAGWPAVNALPREYFDLVYPVVRQYDFAQVWRMPSPEGFYPAKSNVCPDGDACGWKELAIASNTIRDTVLGAVGAPVAIDAGVRAAAVAELGKAAERVQALSLDGITGWKTTGFDASSKLPWLRKRVA